MCPHCGGTHTGLPTDYGCRLPNEVQESTVQALWALEDQDGSHLPPEPGTLACEIPCYPNAKGLPVRVQFGPGHLRPFFYCAEGHSHPLATDQRHGIDEAKYHAIVDAVGVMV